MPAQEIGNFQLFTQVKNSFDKTNKLHTKVNLKVLLIKTKKNTSTTDRRITNPFCGNRRYGFQSLLTKKGKLKRSTYVGMKGKRFNGKHAI